MGHSKIGILCEETFPQNSVEKKFENRRTTNPEIFPEINTNTNRNK